MKRQLHIVSTGKQTSKMFLEKVISIHKAVDFIHIREHSWTVRELTQVIKQLVQCGVPLQKIIINGRVDVAVAVNARGVQLGSHRVDVMYVKKHYPQLMIGCSVHDVDEAIEKEEAGADYLIYGHIYPTNSKKGLKPRGLVGLREVINHVSIPVIGIGGITPNLVQSVVQEGADGIAVLSGVLLSENAVSSVRKYNQALEE